MIIKTHKCNGYTEVSGKFFDTSESSVINSEAENLDQNTEPFYAKRNTDGYSGIFPLSTGSSMIDEDYPTSENVTEEILTGAERLPKTEYYRPNGSDISWSLSDYSPGAVDFLAAPTLKTPWLELEEPNVDISRRAAENFTREPSMELLQEDCLRLTVPRSFNMWSPPPSPIYQNSPSPMEDYLSDLQSVFPNSRSQSRSTYEQNIGIKLLQKTFDESKDGSFLFVTTNNVEKLQHLLSVRGLEVQDIGKTRNPGVLVVLFKSHEFAKRAFTTQQEIGIRMEPPNFTKRNWLKNPSPKFPVFFETTRRLTLKAGKASSNVKIGDFLMMDAKMGRGCLLLADQEKGRRLRIVGYIGKFKTINGRIIEQRSMSKGNILGWISTQSHKTKQRFVLRKSMNKISDYFYDDGFGLVSSIKTW